MRPECERELRRWRLVLPRRVVSGVHGDLRARGVGASSEFETHRAYTTGDDPRRVDWRAYARTERLQVRLARAEVAPALDVIVDLSASMAITVAKADATRDLVAAAGEWGRGLSMRARVFAGGGAVLGEGVPLEFAGRERSLVPRAPLRPQAVRMVVSDFLWPGDPSIALARLAAGSAHLFVVQLLDPGDVEPAVGGSVALVDCEDESAAETILDAHEVAAYRKRLERLCGAVDQAARRIGSRAARVIAGEPGAVFRQLAAAGVIEPA